MGGPAAVKAGGEGGGSRTLDLIMMTIRSDPILHHYLYITVSQFNRGGSTTSLSLEHDVCWYLFLDYGCIDIGVGIANIGGYDITNMGVGTRYSD